MAAKSLVFLGIDSTAELALPLAAAQQAAQSGKRVLFISQQVSDHFSVLTGQGLNSTPTEIQPKLWAVQARTTDLLEQNWNRIRALEEQYLRTPFFRSVYGQELPILPGLDELLLLLALRDWEREYDVMVWSLSSDLSLLRLLASPDQLSWYVRRFQEAFRDSPVSMAVMPFLEPITSAVMAGTLSREQIGKTGSKLTDLLALAQKAARKQVVLFLVTDGSPLRVRQAQRLWGSADLFELQVSGVLATANLDPSDWDPLPIYPVGLPQPWTEWQIPDLSQLTVRSATFMVDPRLLTVRVFLPGFDKKEIVLSQDGPELTLRVADQRRNIALPPSFKGRRVQGAKFADRALVIQF